MTTASTSSTGDQREHLRGFLRDANVPCPGCGYSLRGCAGERCPECGSAFTLGLVLTHATSAWWFAALMGALASVAMAAWLVFRIFSRVVVVVEDPSLRMLVDAGMAPTSALPNWNIAIASVALMLAALLLLAAVLGLRRRFALLPNRWQRFWGVLALISPLLVLGVVALLPRIA